MPRIRRFAVLSSFAMASSIVLAQPIEIDDFDPASTLINFDNLEQGPLIDELADQFVVFENTQVFAGAFPVSAPNLIRRLQPGTIVRIRFTRLVTQAGLQIDSDGYAPSRLPVARFYDRDNDLLAQIAFDQGPDFAGFEAADGIGSIELLDVLSGGPSDSHDDLRFTVVPCAADLDDDGQLTIFDFLAFQNLFDMGDPVADFDGDGELTIFDFLAFQNAFDAGCP
ncbi:MAG: GC-type dockerin domain-anchored protein [Phycisphaerales bacterium JB060]